MLAVPPLNYLPTDNNKGIAAGDGFVRQFVAMPLGRGYTIEGQMMGQETFGGVQIEVFPEYRSDFTVATSITPAGEAEEAAATAPTTWSKLDLIRTVSRPASDN